MKSHFHMQVTGILILLIITTCISSGASSEVSNQSQLNIQNDTVDREFGPDYVISDISLAKKSSWIEPGMSITPNVTIRNTGGDDTISEPVQIFASLGSYQLTSQNNTISPMKGGEEQQVNLEYIIPDGIPSREYPLIITLDPSREKTGINTKNNEVKASALLTIRTITPKVKVSSCGCS